MQPDARDLIEIAGITMVPIGLYDAPEKEPFAPFAEPGRCFFSSYQDWAEGKSIIVSEDNIKCPGGGYWLCGVESMPRDNLVKFLAEKEGLKSSPAIIEKWLENQSPYRKQHKYIVIGPLKENQYDYLRTVTFFVNPDQLSLLLTGAEYHNASPGGFPAISSFGSGCGQMAALLGDLDLPKAIIGATDIAMRKFLPPDLLALTVTKPMFKQLCNLDKDSFLYKPFWKELRQSRVKTVKGE
ncbi:MAG: DUF169 domain-containing protein [Candidatus Krumholzibacteriota bacterium]|nr:DUF169 domain-containing protein [Candidatus Krumholzibacteriota bacterium]